MLQTPTPRCASATFRLLLPLLAAGALGACSGGSGPATEQNAAPAAQGPSGAYTGPAPATPDVQAFKINLFDNVRSDSRCGSCHGVGGAATTAFARDDDVNLAYAAANTVVDLFAPADSEMVQRMLTGHNCWLASDDACATIMTTWIENWAGNSVGAEGRKIELEPPIDLRAPGESRNFPDDNGFIFSQTVYPVLTDANFQGNCAQCHSTASAAQQSPFFAEGPVGDSDALLAAYAAARPRINLNLPAASRFVERVRDESHNCWTDDCAADADRLEAAIAAFAAQVDPDAVSDNLVTSMALTLYEGTIASGGNRHEANVIASYEFKEGPGSLAAFDTSGVDPAMDLTLSGNVDWVGGWGLKFEGGKAQATTATSSKLRSMITATGEYSIEAWVAPGNVVQQDARIVSYSGSPDIRNFNLGQTMYNYDFFNRNDGVLPELAENGNPQLSTPDAAEVLQATLQHVVATFDPIAGRRIYVNGVLATLPDPTPGDTLNSWYSTYAFVLGNEVSGTRPFNGVLRMVAIHNRALTEAQIGQNFAAGVGQKFFLLFSVTHLIGVPESYVVFEASIYDSYAYLFRQPFFISLDPTATPDGIDLEGVRIGINGVEVPVGQAFANVDTVISGALYDSESGQPIAELGTVVPVGSGPDTDEFFLSFDRIGASTSLRPPPPQPQAPDPVDLPPAARYGVRTFDEINAALSELTGVSALDATVSSTFAQVRQSLPATPALGAVLASHQVAIAQLAIAYCDALVEDPAARGALWGGSIVWAVGPSGQAAGWENALAAPLLNRLVGPPQLISQPDRVLIEAEIDVLINGDPDLDNNGLPDVEPRPGLVNTGADTPQRTATIAKSVCAAIVGSATLLVK